MSVTEADRELRKGDTVRIDYPELAWAHGKTVVITAVEKMEFGLAPLRCFCFDFEGSSIALPLKYARRVAAERQKRTKYA